LEFRGLFAQVEPIEEGVGVFEPDAEPIGDFFFFGALGSFDFWIARDHLGTALAEARNVEDSFDGGVFALRAKFAH